MTLSGSKIHSLRHFSKTQNVSRWLYDAVCSAKQCANNTTKWLWTFSSELNLTCPRLIYSKRMWPNPLAKQLMLLQDSRKCMDTNLVAGTLKRWHLWKACPSLSAPLTFLTNWLIALSWKLSFHLSTCFLTVLSSAFYLQTKMNPSQNLLMRRSPFLWHSFWSPFPRWESGLSAECSNELESSKV